MRHFYLILISILSIIVLGSCNPSPNYIYGMRVEERVNCAHDAEIVEFEYILHSAVDKSTVSVTATSSAEWITTIDTSEIGTVRFTVEPNSGESRSTTITLQATEHAPAKIQVTQFGTPPAKANHTLMFLFVGTSLDRYFSTNIDDAKKAIKTGILGDANRVLYLRQSSKTEAYINELCYDTKTGECAERRVVSNIALSPTQVTPEELARYIDLMAEEAPAERYGLIMAGHGQAWIPREALNGTGAISTLGTMSQLWTPAPGTEVTRAFGERNVQFDIEEIAQGIELSSIELDYILFDACFMSNIEAIYDLRHAANYIIASPCEIMGRGFPYERTLPHLFTDNGNTTDYVKAAESYYKYYRDEYSNSLRCGSIAVIDCHEVEILADITSRTINWGKFYRRDDLQTYEGQKPHFFFDFGHWGNILALDSQVQEEFNQQLAKCVIAKYTLPTFYSAYGSYGTYPIDESVYSGVTTSAPTESAYYYDWIKSNWHNHIRPETLDQVEE